jgi:ribokinase
MKPIVVVGSINMDLVSRIERIPRPGETLIGSLFEIHSGGKGANQAVAIARLGYPSILLGALGNDIFGQKLLATLTDYGVDTSHTDVVSGASGVASIVVDAAGENTIIVTPGANAQVTPEYLSSKREILRGAGMVLAQLEIPVTTVDWLAGICADYGVPFMLDPAPACPLPSSTVRNVAWFTPNETEAAFYSGEAQTIEETLTALANMGVANIVLKRGAEGAILATQGEIFPSTETFSVDAVDTTAAGDAFNGAFAVGLMQGNSVAESARFAAAAAAVSVTRRGAQPSLPDKTEVSSFLRSRLRAPAIRKDVITKTRTG